MAMVLGGVVYLTYLAAKGTCKVAWAVIKGTGQIVADAQRGRRIRHARDVYGDYERRQREHDQQDRQKQQRNYEQSIQQMNRQHGRVLNNIQQQMRSQREAHAQALRKMQAAHKKQLDQRCDALANDLTHAEQRFSDDMDTLKTDMDQRFTQEREAVEQRVSEQRRAMEHVMEAQRQGLQAQLNAIQQDVANQEKAAAEWIASVREQLAFIEDNYRHEFFAPGEVARLRKDLALAENNHRNRMFEAALSSAQERFLEAGALCEKLDLLQHEWQTWRLMARESLAMGRAALDAHRSFKLTDIAQDGVPIEARANEIDVDVDYWTRGALSKLEHELADTDQRIEGEQAQVSLDELKQFEQAGRDAMTNAPILAASSKMALIASTLRANMQQDFAAKLIEAGYQVEDNVWRGNDDRNANHLFLRGPTGDRLTIVIAPKQGQGLLSNKVDFYFNDAHGDEALRKEKVESLQAMMQEIYDIPGDIPYVCHEGTDWSTHAAEEHFDARRIEQQREQT